MNFRADAIAIFTYAVTLAAPVVTWMSLQKAKARAFEQHRARQVGLLAVCWLAVLLLEVKIRLSGGSGSLVATASPEYRGLARALVGVHITGAVVTYVVWTWLAVASWRRFRGVLPGEFSPRHKRFGLFVFGGLLFTAASATGMFFFTFVL